MNSKANKQYKTAFNYKVIYAFTINDATHHGLIKIGDASLETESSIDSLFPNCKELNQAAMKRIEQYTSTAGIKPVLLHTELATKLTKINENGNEIIKLTAFRDHDVHRVLKNSKIENVKIEDSKAQEWFRIGIETVKQAIQAVKENYCNLLSKSRDEKYTPIIFRPEQQEAINLTVKQFAKSNRMLWNAKMRFGKTLSALEVIKQCNFKKSIILTHRPVVDAGWYDDFKKIFHGMEDYLYGSKSTGYTFEDLNSKNKNFVYFASLQDLRGSKSVGGKFDKNQEIFDTVWDCVIVDEAHEGTKTSLGDETIKEIVKEDLNKTKFLALSGTPFNILDEYDEDSIYTWDYIMEQECKSEWDKYHFGDSNPYAELPELCIYTYDLGELLHDRSYISYEDKAFNFHEFFRTWTGDFSRDYAQMPQNAKPGDFVHEQDIVSFLNLLTKKDEKSSYPYSKEEYRELFKHSLWMVPGVKEAKALKELMSKHKVFGNGQFDIINVAGSDDEESADALTSVKNAISKAEQLDRYTITLSCGKLTTGVTVKEWTAVFMLSGSYSTSAANYLQTIFRVQSPCNKNGKIKETAYVFDFAPDRTLKMVAEAVSVSKKAGKSNEGDKKALGKFLNYCPVIAISGSQMKEYKADRLLQELKKAYADKVVRHGFDDSNLYNDELLKLTALDIEKFDELKGIIGKSAAAPKQNDIKVNEQGLTNEEYEEQERLNKKPKRELTEEEKARLEELKKKKKVRADAISILRGISIRMPLLIYGADVPYEEEITLDSFIEKVDDSSWKEFMPNGVDKKLFKTFKKYYDEDVFIAAGRKIRKIAREADTLNPTERVKKIASLFSHFKNPDKETVLTPWRVVNMHMSDTLGGYDFWDEKHENTIDEPRFADQGKVTAETLGNPSAKILEINSKTGLYPLYVAYSIYRTKCKEYSENNLTLDLQRKIWNKTVRKNVFVICKTPMAKQITQRTLAGYADIKINAHYFDDLINMLQHKSKQFIEKVLNPSYWNIEGSDKMNFNAVVGNPPYQIINTGKGKGSDPIYHLFIDVARKIGNKGTFIHPARFLFNAGKTPKEWNNKMLNDRHFKVVNYWANSMDIFPSVDIMGGIAVTYWNKEKEFNKIGTFIVYDELRQILNKVLPMKAKSFSDIVYPRDLYRLNDFIYKENEWANTRPSKGHKYDVGTNVFDMFPELFTETKPKSNDTYIQIFGRQNSKRVYRWVKRKYLDTPDNFEYYKIFIPKSNGSSAIGEALSAQIIGQPTIGQPYYGHTVTFLSIGKFNTLEEVSAAYKYICTKFTRVLLSTIKVTQDNSKETWANIPLQDFTPDSDIDWTKSIPEIDQQLYKKYNLNQEEINFIENKIKPME